MRRKKLYKSADNKVFFGICGGVGEFLGVDPTIVRLVWAGLTLLCGLGLGLYILAIFIMPREPVD
ncbi:MAG: PspC domain-containing protein [Lachnospiraceae bacterium]|nr:PspC domain-containing protein [Lachnospiraceae bacterium]